MVQEQVDAALKRNNSEASTKMATGSDIFRGRLKSPSDTAIYTPVIARINTPNLNGSPNYEVQVSPDSKKRGDLDNLDETLTKFRMLSDSRPTEQPQPSTSRQDNSHQNNMRVARGAAEAAILDAERCKAQIHQPNRGTPLMQDYRNLRYLDHEDDEFFHITCHIDSSIKERIEQGLFVELEKLLQKKLHAQNDNRLQLVNKDGVSYFVPPIDRDTKIDSIRKWEQAFRMYSTIYCNANPNRSGEILQYVDTIHRAASIFNWDNVARYDYVFRQLMATKPHRSWAKVYTQMWNLTLNEPIKKFQESNSNYNHGSRANGKKKDNICWKFNKNSCSYGKNCKFEHKCSYCGSHGHAALSCQKKQNRAKKSNGTSNGNGQQGS